MKPICIVALVLGLGAAGVGIYHVAETYPNVKAFGRRTGESRLDVQIWRSYRQAGWIQIYSMWGVGGLGLILGVLGAIKARSTFRILAISGAALSAGALIISLTTMMAGRVG